MQSRLPACARSAGLVVLAVLCTSGAFSPISLLSDGGPPPTPGEGRSETADATGGLRVTAFAVGENPYRDGGYAIGVTPGSLHDVSRGVGADSVAVAAARGLHPDAPQVVTGRCDVQDEVGQLVVELTRPTDATASTEGVAVDHAVPGEAGTRRVVIGPFVAFCAADDHSSELCGGRSHPES